MLKRNAYHQNLWLEHLAWGTQEEINDPAKLSVIISHFQII